MACEWHLYGDRLIAMQDVEICPSPGVGQLPGSASPMLASEPPWGGSLHPYVPSRPGYVLLNPSQAP